MKRKRERLTAFIMTMVMALGLMGGLPVPAKADAAPYSTTTTSSKVKITVDNLFGASLFNGQDSGENLYLTQPTDGKNTAEVLSPRDNGNCLDFSDGEFGLREASSDFNSGDCFQFELPEIGTYTFRTCVGDQDDSNQTVIFKNITIVYTAPSAPTVTAISPSTGLVTGGTSVTITGTNFVDGSSVKIGDNAATGVSVSNATTLTATTPAGTAGAKDVTVTTPGGTATGAGLFTYAVPTMNVTGNGISIASGDTTPSTDDGTDFGDVIISKLETVTKMFTICNNGTAPLNLTGSTPVSIEGTGAACFTVTQPTDLTIAAGRTATFQIVFTTASKSPFAATVSIANDSVTNPYTFAIIGTGKNVEANLLSLAGKTCSLPGKGSTQQKPVEWSIDVDADKASIGKDDISVSKYATVTLYSDSAFTKKADSIPLTPGGSTLVYVDVTPGNVAFNDAYYAVTVNRAKPAFSVTASAGSASFTDGDNTTSTPVCVDSGIALLYPDHTTLASAIVSVTGGFHNGEDVLEFTNTDAKVFGDIAGTYAPSSGVLTMTSPSGNATLSQWQAALCAVMYTNSSRNPSGDTRTITFTVNGDGSDSAGTTRTVTVTPVDSAPILAATAGKVSFTENGPQTAIDSSINVSDYDNGTLASATVSISTNFDKGKDKLSCCASDIGNIDPKFDENTGVLTLTSDGATATIAQWQTALQNVMYSNASDDPSGLARTVTFTVSDGTRSSNAVTREIDVTPVNDAPTGIAISSSTVMADAAAGTPVGTLSATDVDSPASSFTFSLADGGQDNSYFAVDGNTLKTAKTFDNNSTTLSITVQVKDQAGATYNKTLSIQVLAFALSNSSILGNSNVGTVVGTFETGNAFTYELVSGDESTDNASFAISGDKLITTGKIDHSVKSSCSIRVRITGGNSPVEKIFTITIGENDTAPTDVSLAPASVPENSVVGTKVGDLSATDSNSGDKFTYSLVSGEGGTDNSSFTIDGDALKTAVIPDYETKKSYSVRVRATDSGGLFCEKELTVTVTDINEAPTVTSAGSVSFPENGTGVVYTAIASDPDVGDTAFKWSLGGTDASLFSIDEHSGAVTFKTAPDFENPQDANKDNVYDIEVTATDKGGLTASKAIAITVTDVDEAPVITSSDSASFTENGTGPVYTAQGYDPEKKPVIWSITGDDASLFKFDAASGAVTFATAPKYSADKNTYSISVNASDGKLVTTKTITIKVTQAQTGGGFSGGGSQSATVDVNGKAQSAGTAQTSTDASGRKETTVTVDSSALKSAIDSQGSGATITIPVTDGAKVATGVLTGDMVKTMETKDAVLEIKTATAQYSIPASEINIGTVSSQLGTNVSLPDVKVGVSISEPTEATAKVVSAASAAGGFTVQIPAVEFSITCTYNGQTVNVSSFNSYVERMITVPSGVDPSKITTGVVVKPDGTTYQVPTQIIVKDGVYYAKINSLTNSTYTVVWHPLTFADVTNHWAKSAINDMGSRMVVYGDTSGNYDPDRSITRAEFSAVIVRALGLAPDSSKCSFADVGGTDWSRGYIGTATAYGIIKGYSADAFGGNDLITREQAMAMLSRAMKLTGLNAGTGSADTASLISGFTDGSTVSDYAKDAVTACLKTGIVSGRDDGTLAPVSNVTRAEVAVMAQRLLQKSGLIN